MSKVLLIRHLPSSLTLQDKEQLLKHFGAEKVWEKSPKRNYVFASFPNVESAKATLLRLHQLEIAKRRIVVEYCLEKVPIQNEKYEHECSSIATKKVKEYLRLLNAWNPSVNFYQPPSVNLLYKYPQPDINVIINVIQAMLTHHQLYVQIIHLMNKMCLTTPFQQNDDAVQTFKEYFRHLFVTESVPLPCSENESELSSDEGDKQIRKQIPKSVKRLPKLPVTRKRPAAILSTAILPKARKTQITQEVFENVTLQEPKKIALVVPQDALTKSAEEPEVVGELGKYQKEEQLSTTEETQTEIEQPTISRKELLRNRLSYSDMKILPVFKNYHPGQPSLRLYIKNLAKTVTDQDVKRIYKHYVEHLTEQEQLGFDVRVMQEGKMKGQAFVTFPSMRIAETALNETNGFLLKEKPMVVQFARAANKKSIE